jgi:hypothetical protein
MQRVVTESIGLSALYRRIVTLCDTDRVPSSRRGRTTRRWPRSSQRWSGLGTGSPSSPIPAMATSETAFIVLIKDARPGFRELVVVLMPHQQW